MVRPLFPPVRRTLLTACVALIGSWSGWVQAVAPRQLLEVVDFGPPAVSADGGRVAFRVERALVERNTYESRWFVQRLDDGSAAQEVADGGEPLRSSAGVAIPSLPVWAPDGEWIYYLALIDGKVDVWRAATDGAGAEPLTLDPADVMEFRLAEDGLSLDYAVGATRDEVVAAEIAEYEQGVRIDGSVPVGQSLHRSGMIRGRPATQRFGGAWFDRVFLLDDAPIRWKRLDLTAAGRGQGAVVEITGFAEAPPPLVLPEHLEPWRTAYHPTTGSLAALVRTGERDGLRQRPDVSLVAMVANAPRQVVKCSADLCTNRQISSVQWRPDSTEVLFTVTDPAAGLAQSIGRWDVESDTVHPVVHVDGLVNGGRDLSSLCGASAQVLACVVAGATQPPRLEKIDIDTGAATVLFQPNQALAEKMAGVPVELLRWTDRKGREFTGQYFPAQGGSGGPYPLFVHYYRCPGFLRGGMGDEWPLASLASRGISTLCINAAPSRVDALERYDHGLTATESAIDLLSRRGEVDPGKVGFGGLSFGSEVALWLSAESTLLAAVSVSTPVISPAYYMLNLLKGDDFLAGLSEYWGLGTPAETPYRWQSISPASKLDRINVPLIFQMSEQEYLSSVDYTLPLVKDQRAELWVFPDEPHQKFQPKHKLSVYQRNLDWFIFWLRGMEDADEAKSEQYRRWREIRARLSADDA